MNNKSKYIIIITSSDDCFFKLNFFKSKKIAVDNKTKKTKFSPKQKRGWEFFKKSFRFNGLYPWAFPALFRSGSLFCKYFIVSLADIDLNSWVRFNPASRSFMYCCNELANYLNLQIRNNAAKPTMPPINSGRVLIAPSSVVVCTTGSGVIISGFNEGILPNNWYFFSNSSIFFALLNNSSPRSIFFWRYEGSFFSNYCNCWIVDNNSFLKYGILCFSFNI